MLDVVHMNDTIVVRVVQVTYSQLFVFVGHMGSYGEYGGMCKTRIAKSPEIALCAKLYGCN